MVDVRRLRLPIRPVPRAGGARATRQGGLAALGGLADVRQDALVDLLSHPHTSK